MEKNILENKRILVVEDNVINQMVVKHTLCKLNAEIDIAGDGKEAIEKIKLSSFDLILMDIQMPVMDGYETTLIIRNQLKSKVPIIAMTAFALKEEVDKCFEKGMNGYISKPFTLDSLYTAIYNAFKTPYTLTDNPNFLSNSETTIDLSMVNELFGDDEASINSMIHIFLDNIPVTLDRIEEACIRGEWQEVYKAAHYAKSSLSVIKVNEMFDCIVAIEYNANNQLNLAAIPSLIARLKQKFPVVKSLLVQKLSNQIKSSMV